MYESRKKSLINLPKQLALNTISTKIGVYPVPSSEGKFHLSKSKTWEVYSLLGRKIAVGTGSLIDISKFSKGIYILKTDTGVTKKLLYN